MELRDQNLPILSKEDTLRFIGFIEMEHSLNIMKSKQRNPRLDPVEFKNRLFVKSKQFLDMIYFKRGVDEDQIRASFAHHAL